MSNNCSQQACKSSSIAVQAEQSDVHNDNFACEGEVQEKPVTTSFERSSSESNLSSECFSDDDLMESSGTESTDSSSNSSPSSSFSDSGCVEKPDGAYACEDQDHLHGAEIRKLSFQTAVDTSGREEAAPSKSPVKNTSSSSKVEQKDTCHRSKELETDVSSPFSTKFMSCDRHSKAKPSENFSTSHDEVSSATEAQGSGNVNFVKSQISHKAGHVSSGGRNDVQFLPSRKSLASCSSNHYTSSAGGGHSVSNNSEASSRFSENIVLESNGMKDLKTSLARVVLQLKPSKVSKHHSPGLANDVPMKNKVSYCFF